MATVTWLTMPLSVASVRESQLLELLQVGSARNRSERLIAKPLNLVGAHATLVGPPPLLPAGLAESTFDINAIKDVTPVPHNGCRPPKRRRV